MKVTLSDLVETFSQGVTPSYDMRNTIERGLCAVIEKHIGPMIAQAYARGRDDQFCAETELPTADGHPAGTGKDYAARIISSLTAPEGKT